MLAGAVNLKFMADILDMQSKMRQAEQLVSAGAGKMQSSISSMLAPLGAGISIAGLAAFVKTSIDAADNLNDLSKKTGISVERLSGLSLAANQSGTDLDGVAASISKLSQNMGKDAEKFRALGISAKDPLEAFKQLADIFSAVEDPQTRAALGAEALGKSWGSAAPLLAEGGESIGEMVEKGMRLSGVTQQLADDADKFNDQLAEMKAASAGLGMKMAGEMLPALTDITKAVMTAYEEAGKLNAAWVALGAVGAFLFTNEFASAATKIKDLQFELQVLEERKKNTGLIDQMLFGSKNDIIGKIAGVKEQIAVLQQGMQPPAATPKAAPNTALTKGVAGFINKPNEGKSDAQKAAERAAEIQRRLIESGAELAASLIAQDGGLSGDFAKKWESLSVAYGASAINLDLLTKAQAQLLEQQPLMKQAADAQKKADEDATKARLDLSKKYADEQEAAVEKNAYQVEAIRQSLMTQEQAEIDAYGRRLAELVAFRDAKLENEMQGNALMEAEVARHEQAVLDMKAANDAQALAMYDDQAGQLYGLMKQAGMDQSALGKALFLAQKAMAIAQILMNTEVAATQALTLGPFAGPVMSGIIRAMGYASAGMVAGLAIAEASAEGGYDIPAGMSPIVQTHPEEMILPRAQANVIRELANDGGNGRGNSGNDAKWTIVNTGTPQRVVESRTTPDGERILITEDAKNAAVATVVAQLGDPNSKVSRAMGRNYQAQRSRS
jgi:hypothetical protein